MNGSHLHRVLLATVFLTGAVVLIIEIVATRILSPFFGNTLYTISSVIGVILAALSCGYYLGGRRADQQPHLANIFRLILAGGASVLLIGVLQVFVIPLIANHLSLISGPLIISILLFFLPGLLLGTLSPYIIKVVTLAMPERGLGRIAGEVFFWGTVGSIAGSFLAGFYLIPIIGVRQIIVVIGLFLLGLGAVGLVATHPQRSSTPVVVTLLLTLAIALSWFLLGLRQRGIVYAADGVYQTITIFDSTLEGRPTRYLYQDHSLEGGVYLADSSVATPYAHYYALYQLFRPSIDRALVIGGGAYLIPRELLRHDPNVEVETVEIETSPGQLAEQYFALPMTTRHRKIIEEGRRYLQTATQQYDLIFSDAYHSHYSMPAHLTTREFMELAKSKLTPNGVFVANIAGSLKPLQPSFPLSAIRTFQTVFPNSYFFALESPRSTETQNIMLAGYRGNEQLDLNHPSIVNHDNSLIRALPAQSIAASELPLAEHAILTDNYAPVDYMAAQLLKDKSR